MSSQPGQDDRTHSELLNDLRFGSPHAQEEALARLVAVGEAEALDAVIDYLRSQEPVNYDAGLDALRILAGKYMPLDRYGLAEASMPYLSSEDWSQRLGATRLLSAHPNELAAGSLRTLLHEAKSKVIEERRSKFSPLRVVAERTLAESVLALASCGRLMAQRDMHDLLEEKPMRALATRGLGIIGSETDRPLLEDLAEDEDVRTRDAAQWSLALMDERAEQFMRPPDSVPEPPPDRLTPIYWAHRRLNASDDDFLQFLITRVAIEHLMLDALLMDGRVPEECLITVRRFAGNIPPDFRANNAEIVGSWKYYASGPYIEELEDRPALPAPAPQRPGGLPAPRTSQITISYPAIMPDADEGLVSFDCIFEPFLGKGWIYKITQRDGEWTFTVVRRTWSS
jgi:HEAT repeat protein